MVSDWRLEGHGFEPQHLLWQPLTPDCFTNKNFPITLPKIRHVVCLLSVVSTCFQVYRSSLHMAYWNRHVNDANFVVNCHKTPANTLKSCTPFKRVYIALFSVGKVCCLMTKNVKRHTLTNTIKTYIWPFRSQAK